MATTRIASGYRHCWLRLRAGRWMPSTACACARVATDCRGNGRCERTRAWPRFGHPPAPATGQLRHATWSSCAGASISRRWLERATSSFVTATRSEEHTFELQPLMRISYAVFCLKKKNSLQYENEHEPTR